MLCLTTDNKTELKLRGHGVASWTSLKLTAAALHQQHGGAVAECNPVRDTLVDAAGSDGLTQRHQRREATDVGIGNAAKRNPWSYCCAYRSPATYTRAMATGDPGRGDL